MWCTSCEAPYTLLLSSTYRQEWPSHWRGPCAAWRHLLLSYGAAPGGPVLYRTMGYTSTSYASHAASNYSQAQYKYNYNCYTLRSRRDTMLQFQLNLLAERWSHNYRVGCVQSGTISCHTPIETSTASTSPRTYGYNKMAVDSGCLRIVYSIHGTCDAAVRRSMFLLSAFLCRASFSSSSSVSFASIIRPGL